MRVVVVVIVNKARNMRSERSETDRIIMFEESSIDIDRFNY